MPNEYDLSAAFAAIERELTASMMRNLARHRAEETAEGIQWAAWQAEQLDALETYRRRNQKQFGARFRKLNGQIENLLRETHTRGGFEQEEEILRAIREGASGRNLPGGLSGSFFRTNERKLDALIKATTSDMQQAETAVLRAANDQYRKIIYNAQVYANTGAGTYEKAVDMATKDFLSRGIQCVRYSNGARHTLTDYADMAIRTASKRAYLQGEGTKRQEWGVTTVILNKRGNPCPLCRPFCGKVFIDDVWSGGKRSDGKWPLLSEAIAQGLYHPRCKDSHTTWFPELEEETPLTEAEERRQEAEYEQQQKLTGAERQEEKYRRLEAYCLDSDNRKKYAQRARMWEKRSEQPASVAEDAVEALPENTKKTLPREASLKYEDITGNWFPDAVPGSHEVKDLMEYTVDGVTYRVDGKHVVLDYSRGEKAVAELLERTVGGEIFMVPRVNNPPQISTPDYLFNGRPYDLKQITGSSKNTLYNAISKKKRQSKNFIFDITECPLNIDELLLQVDGLYRSSHTRFVEEIILIKSDEILKVFQRK
ncbi:MAG: hypothetical protein IJX71_01805 [Oscillospiraceae bacterium]|nr:hypothetical protein [Oscillospiraceae bacterium]